MHGATVRFILIALSRQQWLRECDSMPLLLIIAKITPLSQNIIPMSYQISISRNRLHLLLSLRNPLPINRGPYTLHGPW